jgi:hypothetical protein
MAGPARKSISKPRRFRKYIQYEILIAEQARQWFLQWFKYHPIISAEGLIVCVAIAWFTGLEAAETYVIQFLVTAAVFCGILYLWGSVRAAYDVWSNLTNGIEVLQHDIRVLKRTKDNVQIIKDRQKWKNEFEKNLERYDDVDRYGNKTGRARYGEAIIRDVDRPDEYPHLPEDASGISPFFKVEIKDFYHRGIEVFMNVQAIKYDEALGRWRYAEPYNETGAINALVVGRIPFDVVRNVEWRGDEYDNIPHIYCEFSSPRGEPYEEILFYKREGSKDHEYYLKVASLQEVEEATTRRQSNPDTQDSSTPEA